MFNRNLINSIQDSLKQVINETKTSERNLEQFRERMASNKAAREKKAEEFKAKKAEEEAARNTPEAKAKAAAAAVKRTVLEIKFLFCVKHTDGRTVKGIINSGNNHSYKYLVKKITNKDQYHEFRTLQF